VRTLILDVVGILATAGSLFIVSSGLTLVFGAMRLINVAHGSFYMLGAFVMTTVAANSAGARFWVAVAAATVVVAVLSVVVEVSVMRRIYASDHLTHLLATFAVSLIVADLALRVWGSGGRSVREPSVATGAVSLGGATFPAYDLVLIAAAFAVGLGLWLLLTRTPFGWRIRAAVDDPELLSCTGTRLSLLRTGVFMLGAALAAFAGALVSPQVTVAPGMDTSIIVSAFIVAVIGGLGSIPGAALGALIIGVAETLGASYAPSWSSSFMYLAMIAVLVMLPSGLLGRAER
jgi:branched-subunit amino acid ABC-type transport system permease component